MIKDFIRRVRSVCACRPPPILVYQMGKVGSSSVTEALKRAGIPHGVHHVHFLSPEGLSATEAYYQTLGKGMPEHVRVGRELRRAIDAGGLRRALVVTLVRDPVARDISDFFQNLRLHDDHMLGADGLPEWERVVTHLSGMFARFDEANDYTCAWFSREFERALGVDIYAHTFDPVGGYSLVEQGGWRILVMQVEALSRAFEPAMRDLLGGRYNAPFTAANIGTEKEFGQVYDQVRATFRLPRDLCARIYNSRYCRHFYSDEQREGFIRRWVKHDPC